MIVSKAALSVVALTGKDKQIPALDCISIERDGTIVAACRNAVIAVSPVKCKVPLTDSGACSVIIEGDTVKKVIQAIGNDTVFSGKLEYADVSKDEFTLTNGKNESTISFRKVIGTWIKWKDILRNAMKRKTSVKCILNRQRLQLLLTVLEKTCPEKGGECPVWLEFTDTDDIIVRGVNYTTGQRVLATMSTYKGGLNKWLPDDEWETNMLKENIITKTKRLVL